MVFPPNEKSMVYKSRFDIRYVISGSLDVMDIFRGYVGDIIEKYRKMVYDGLWWFVMENTNLQMDDN